MEGGERNVRPLARWPSGRVGQQTAATVGSLTTSSRVVRSCDIRMELFGLMNVVTEATSRAIFDDALRAFRDSDHPCYRFKNLQPDVPMNRWQLPEPFNGHAANAGIVFLGLNPSYGPLEAVPRIGSSFEDWDTFYRRRFDSAPEMWHRLYRRYDRIGQLAVDRTFRLGHDGLVMEIVRFRSKSGRGVDAGIIDAELPLTRSLLRDINPRVVVAVGRGATAGLSQVFPQLARQLGTRWGVAEVECQTFWVDHTAARSLAVIPVRHLTRARGYTTALLERAADAVRGVLRPSTP